MEQYVIGNKTLIDNIANNARVQTGETELYTIQGLADAVARGGAVQSDWNENDESSKAYVKNRPFYTTDPVEYVLYDGTYAFSTVMGVLLNMDEPLVDYEIKEGENLTVVFDGVNYNVIAKDVAGTIGFGNLSLFNSIAGGTFEDSGEPFCYLSDMWVVKDGTEHTITLSLCTQDVIQIPEEYIPLNVKNGESRKSVVVNNVQNNIASGGFSIACGDTTTAHGFASHADGSGTVASGSYSLASGYYTTASGYAAHSEGTFTTASGLDSHSEGQYTVASGAVSHAEGRCTIAIGNLQHVSGVGNIESESYYYIVGNGDISASGNHTTREITYTGTRSNAHTLDWSGNAVFAGTVSGTGADYAEHFEWLDGNPDNEDRVGMVVTLEGDKIRKANADDEVLGIVSGTAMVIGDNAEWEWHDKFVTDEYGRVITEMVEEFMEAYNPETNEVERTSLGFFPHRKVNPEWDETKAYTRRSDRPEWDVIGLLGKLYVNDDGTCVVGGYATNADNGIITASAEKTNMRVMKRITDNIVLVFMK